MLKDSSPATQERLPARAVIDTVEIDVDGKLHLTGWAVAARPIVAVDVLADGVRVGTATHGLARPDVAGALPRYPGAASSGFAFTLSDKLAGSAAAVEVVAMQDDGSAASARARVQQVLLHVDHVDFDGTGKLTASGWAMARSGIQRIDVFGPSGFLASTTCHVKRPDVRAKHQAMAIDDEVGFEFSASLPSGTPAGTLLLLRARGRRGEFAEKTLVLKPADARAAQVVTDSAQQLRIFVDTPESKDGVAHAPVHHHFAVRGWALARKGMERIEIRLDDVLLGNAYYGARRPDIEKVFPGWPNSMLSGFGYTVPSKALKDGKRRLDIIAIDGEGHRAQASIELQVQKTETQGRLWRLKPKVALAETRVRLAALPTDWRGLTFVMLLPLAGPWDSDTEATFESLLRQDFPKWRVLVVASGAAQRAARGRVAKLAPPLQERCGVAAADALTWRQLAGKTTRVAVSVMQPGDVYGADALMRFAQARADISAERGLVYADERVRGADGHGRPFFKPGWSPDTLLSTDYLGAGWVADLDVVRSAFASPADLLAAGRYERALRCTEHAAAVGRVAALLVERGPVEDSTAQEKGALREALRRRGEKGRVLGTALPNVYRVARTVVKPGKVSIIIPTIAADGLVKTCVDSIRKKTTYRDYEIILVDNIRGPNKKWKKWFAANADRVVAADEPFNWSRLNNLGREAARGDYLVFLNDDIEVIDPWWIEALLEHAQRPSVGTVGPKLLYPDGKVQHAGLFLAKGGMARHAFRFADPEDGGYFGFAMMQRNVSSITGACMMMRTEVFDELGGFEEAHDVVNNDVDFCLRCHRSGFSVIFTPHATLYHHELASRARLDDTFDSAAFMAAWGDLFATGDPFFNPNLSLDSDDYSPETESLNEVYAGHPLFQREQVRNILVVKLDHIGDFVTALPAIGRLKADFPQAEISALVGPSVAPLAQSQSIISHVHVLPFFHARSGEGATELTEADLLALHDKLAPECFDLAIDLRKNLDTRHVLKYTGARFLAGFDRNNACPWLDIALEWEGDPVLIHKRSHVSGDLLNLAAAVSNAAHEDRSTFLLPRKLPPMPAAVAKVAKKLFSRPVLCMHPASGSELRQWPAGYFAQLIDLLVGKLGVHVAVIGSPDERELAEQVLAGVQQRDRVWSLVGACKLPELPAVIARCNLFVGNNSGPKHLAAGLGVPTVAVHSNAISSEEWGPFGEHSVALRRDMVCGPCYLAKPEDCYRGRACLTGISPHEVFEVCRRFLAAQ